MINIRPIWKEEGILTDAFSASKMDSQLLYLFLFLLMMGSLGILSSSYFLSMHIYGVSYYYFKKHLMYLGLSSIVATVAYRLPTQFWKSVAPLILLGVIGLLILVLIPGVGRHVNGANRWIRVLGINIQVSEVAKLGFILYLANYISRKQDKVLTTFLGFMKPLCVMLFLSGLVLLEPDFGGVFIISLIGGSMLYLAGLPLWVLMFLSISTVSIMVTLIVLTPYRLIRLMTFFNPWANPFGDGYQLTQSLIAVGRGGTTGVGLGYGLQKQLYLPEAHTDFIFAVLVEEMGLVGSLLIVSVFLWLILRLSYWVHQAIKRNLSFEAMTLYGIMVWWSGSVLFSMSVNLGLVPTKGIAMPFFSYGGSSLLVNACAIGIILKITKNLSKE